MVLSFVCLNSCSGGGGGGGNTPAENDQTSTKSCKDLRKDYVIQQVGENSTVANLMKHITEGPAANDFWKNLPKCT